MGLVLSLLAFVGSFVCGRRSLGAGMAVVLTAGYGYGILRANFLDGFSHFIFDSAVLGLYLARFILPKGLSPPNARGLTFWTGALIGWPVLMFVLFFIFPQHLFIQLVGLRAAVWFLPFLLLGPRARSEDLVVVARALAVLNLAALAVAGGEFVLGLEPFFPRNAVTALMYRSNDIGSAGNYRIPATFVQSATYGGVMAATLPLLVGRLPMPGVSLGERCLIGAGLLAAGLGTFLCGSRLPVVYLLVLSALAAYHFRIRLRYLVLAALIAGVVGYFVAGSERLQRFTSLQDTDAVAERVEGSANVATLELFVESPFGVGLGRAFGTSIPSFLEHLAMEPIGAENEYARIGLEQGVVGVGLWLGFLVWFFAGRRPSPSPAWQLGAKLMYALALLSWGTAFLGTGMLTSIPGTCLLLFQMGVLGRDFVAPPAERRPSGQSRDVAVSRGAGALATNGVR